ncbi:MAG: DUF6448 family protein, partial [Thermoanaerobaculia bacterium]
MIYRILGITLASLLITSSLFAHCDSLSGPVIVEARAALEAGDIAPVLKWIPADAEKEIRSAFARTLAVRKQGAEAKQLADTWFFETLVRVHRASEGAPYTGLKSDSVDPGIDAADKALEASSLDALEKSLRAEISAGLRKRFAHASEAKAHAGHNVGAGREYVHAYVEFIHYVERLQKDATTPAAHAAAAPEHAAAAPEHA